METDEGGGFSEDEEIEGYEGGDEGIPLCFSSEGGEMI